MEDLDKILDKLGRAISAHPRGEGPAHAYTEAKQALTELIEREKKKAHHNGYTAGHYKGRNSMDEVIIEARINELENIPVGWPKIIISDSEAYHLLKQVIQDRLAELKPSKETAE